MKTAQHIFDENFTNNPGRTPRSAAYKRGYKECLKRKIEGVKFDIPYKAGTSEFDAYFAGTEEANNAMAIEKNKEGEQS